MGCDPLVSVVLAARNAERTLRSAIDSVLVQTVEDLELIVCDDGSRDGTPVLLGRYSDRRMSVLRNQERIGPGLSRDKAISVARGKWIAVIDGDDMWKADRLEVLLRAAGGQADAMVFDDVMECHDAPSGMVPWRRLRGPGAFSTDDEPSEVLFADFVRSRRLLIKPLIPAEFVRCHGLRHSARMFAEDTEFFLQVMAAGARLVYVPRALYQYRITPNSLTANPDRDRCMMEVLQDARDKLFFRSEDREALDAKMRQVACDIRYAPVLAAVKEGNALGVARLLISRPELLREFLRRSAESVLYRLHRFRHRAQGR